MPPTNSHAIRQSKRCGAKLRGERAGRTCMQWAMPNGRCKMHGGKHGAGVAAPAFRHGRYSKALPSGLLARYQIALTDPDLHNLAEEIRLVDARVSELLAKLQSQDGAGKIREAMAHLHAFRASSSAGDVAQARAVLGQLEAALQAGASAEAVWDQVFRAADMRRRLVESDARRRHMQSLAVPVERAMAFAQALAVSVREHVTDEQAVRKIQADMRAFGVSQ